MSDQEEEEKQHEPTQKKLDDARRKGEIPRSADLATAGSYGGFLLFSAIFGAVSLSGLGEFFSILLGQSDTISREIFRGGSTPFIGGVLGALLGPLLPVFLVPALVAFLVILTLKGMVFAPEKLAMKGNRISPLSNAKNKFGRNGLFEFAKSFVKLLIYSFLLGGFLYQNLPKLIYTTQLSPEASAVVMVELATRFLFLSFLATLLIGGIDFLWQTKEHHRRHRMSRKEMTDETKQSEGDPHMKQQRRQKGLAIATNQMLAEVPDADVVIVNPTHYAVALRWSRDRGAAPVCTAKGVDEIAARIREIAAESGVPLHSDPPTARAIYATVEIGQEIPPEQYRAVAAAIRFSETMRRKASRRYRGSDG